MLDLQQRFEELGHDAPAHPPVGERLDAGHRALRSRRGATGAATLVAVVVVGTGAWALGGGDNRAGPEPDFASDPTTSPAAVEEPIPIPVGSHEELAQHRGEGVFYEGDSGELKRDVGAEVTRLVPDPIPTDARKSVALELDYRGETRWMYLYWSPDSGGSGSDPAEGGETFDDWVATLDPDSLQANSGWEVAKPVSAEPDQDAGRSR